MPDKKNDVSNQTVAVLLVLTLIVTVVGTWLVLDTLIAASAAPPPLTENTGVAEVSLTLIGPPPVSTQTAEVGLELTPPQG